MSPYMQFCYPNLGSNPSFIWDRYFGQFGMGWVTWYVNGKNQFAKSGPAVVDDFGNLVLVPHQFAA